MRNNQNHLMRFIILLQIASFAFISSCTSDLASGTSGSETGNGKLSGRIVDSCGNGVTNTQVVLLPCHFDPCKDKHCHYIDTTDASGNYSIVCDTGNYSLYAVNFSNRKSAYLNKIEIDSSTIVAGDDTLWTPGAVRISRSREFDLLKGYFYIPGTTIFSYCNKATSDSSAIMFDSIPAGLINAICYSAIDNFEVRIVRNNVQIASGSIVDILYPEWNNAQKLYLNTTATGAPISETLFNFPVLVRLTKQNFTFHQSNAFGLDLLFVKPDGKRLPFEVERWDTTSGYAEIWVNVDTIKAGNDSQYITMLWGYSGYNTPSEGSRVFDTANGFQGVWHLDEDPLKGTDAVRDRTYNKNHGTQTGSRKITAANGLIGNSLYFSAPGTSTGSAIKLPNASSLDYKDTLTVSCWIRLNENTTDSFGIAGKFSINEDSTGKCISTGYSLFYNSKHFIHFQVGTGSSTYRYIESDVTIADTNWHHIVATLYAGRMNLYIDGVKQTATSTVTPVPSTTAGMIGRFSSTFNNQDFSGAMDELRISNTSLSVSWIKLCYLNQKSNERLIFRK